MARAQGARAQMALAFETVYGTPPGSGFTQMPFITSSLAAEQPLLASELLGYGRDPRAPLLDAITTDGDVEVPIDAVGFGFWLKAAFGAPTTAGTVAATGSITFSAQPAVNSTLTINGTAFTFVASGATGNQVNLGANLAATMTALAVALNASVVAGVALATYTGTATALTIVFDVLGSTGNTFTLAASISPSSNGTVSGATLTGGLNSHTFMSGSWNLPSMSIEVAMPEVPRFAMYSGCVLDSLSWSMERSGLLGAKTMLVAQGEAIAGTTAASTPAAIALKRFGHFNGAIKRDGLALGNIVSADLTYANNLDRIETIRSDAKIDGADPTIAALTGKIEVRFADTTLLTQAINGTAAALEFSYVLPSGESLTLTAHAVYLPRPRIDQLGLAPAHVAEMAGVNRSFVYDILRGRSARPSIDRLADVARVLKVDREWLIHGIGEIEGPSPFTENPEDTFVAIAHATPRPAMGGGTVVTEDGDTPGRAYHFRQSWIRHKLKASPSHLRIMHVEGDSMVPTLQDGDAVLVDMTRQFPSPPGIFVLDDGMGLVAKRLEHIPNSDPPAVRVISDNTLYPAYERTADEIRIIGRIRWFAREM